MCIQWGNSISSKFSVGNGVKQGGILSPKLCNVSADSLFSAHPYFRPMYKVLYLNLALQWLS